MSRTRLIHPGLFRNEDLAELPPLTRWLFAGLWCWADRAGRLEDRPRRLGADILPFDDGYDTDQGLSDLARKGFIRRYEVDGRKFIQVVNFSKYQKPHLREKATEIPEEDLGATKASPRHNLGDEQAVASRAVSTSVSDPDPDPVSDPEPERHTCGVPAIGAKVADALPSHVGRERPVAGYTRLRIFPWMQHEMVGHLGNHAVAFDLDAFLQRLDASGDVLPAKLWPWLLEMVLAEASRRGMQPATPASTTPSSKRIAGLVTGGHAFLRRVAEAEARS